MLIKKNDFFYVLLAIAASALGVVAIGNPNAPVGLYGLLGLVGIALIMTIIIKPSFGAWILILAIFTNISDNLTNRGYPGLIKPLVMVVALALLVHYIYTEQRPEGRSKTRRIEMFLFLYFLVVSISFIVASNKDRALAQIVDLVKDIGIIYCILFALRQFESWKLAVWVIILSATFLCLLEMYQIITSNYGQTFMGLAAVQMEKVFETSYTPRLSGPVNEPNVWGLVLVAVIPLVIYRIFHERLTLVKFLCVAILGLLLVIIFNTYSRGAYVGLVIIIGLIMLEKRLKALAVFGGFGLFVILILVLPSKYLERFQTLTLLSPTSQNGIYQDSSFRGRGSEVLTGLRMFYEHPLLGVGAGNYNNNYQQYAQLIGIEYRNEEREPHSLYVQLLAETGILGTIAFLGIVVSLLGGLDKSIKAIKHLPSGQAWLPWISAIRLSIIAYLVSSLFLHMAYIRYFWILVALALSAIQITNDLLNNSQKAKSLGVQS